MYKLSCVVIASVILSACSPPLCPRNQVQRGHLCSRCPEGSVMRGNLCITLDGGVVVEPVGASDGGEEVNDEGDSSSERDASTAAASDANVNQGASGGDSGTGGASTMDAAVNADASAGGGSDATSSSMSEDAASPATTSDASSTLDASTRDAGSTVPEAGTDAGAPPPPYTGLPQQAYLKARNAEASDQFGAAIAISGTTLIVGAPGEDSSAIAVNGNEHDNTAANTGAVYVFVMSGSQWVQEAYLKPIATAVQHFGKSVAIDGDTVLVGSDDRAWLYSRSQTSGGGRWTGTTVFQLPSEALEYTPGGGFGASVALSKDYVIVGAPTSSRGMGDGVIARGSVLLFTPTPGGGWQQSYRFLGESDPSFARFTDYGAQVALSGNLVAIGAPTDWRGSNNNLGPALSNVGCVWLFTGSGTSWSASGIILKASNRGAEDRFGSALSLQGTMLAVGAPGEASSTGAVIDEQAPNAGAVYLFAATIASDRSEQWIQQAYLKAPAPRSDDRFGASVSLRGDMLAVGAPGADSGTGRVYVLRRFGSTWAHQTTVGVLPRDANDNFGTSVAVSDDVIAVGTPSESSNAKGLGATVGQQNDNSAPGSGAAYSFARPF